MDSIPNYYAIVPANVRYSKKLSPFMKLLYAEIAALSNKEGFCWASNAYFADLYKSTPRWISNCIGKLEKAGFIHVEDDAGGSETRKIFLADNGVKVPPPPRTKVPIPPRTKVLPNNTSINITDVSKDTSGDAPFSTMSYIGSLRRTGQPRNDLVADYWSVKAFHFTSKADADKELRRDYAPIKQLGLTDYDSGRVLEVMRWLEDNVDFKWTLETIPKYINEDLSKLKGDKVKMLIIK